MRIDCHCHTIYSKHPFWGFDALNSPLEMIKAAVKNNLDGLAITDHNTIKGGLVAKKAAKRFKGFVVLVGTEVRTKDGEIIALDVKDDVPQNLEVEEVVEKIHDLGGIAVAPHPFGSYFFRRCTGRKALMADAVEVYNSTLTKGQNKKAMDMVKLFKKPFTAGSDSHTSKEVGNAGIIVDGDPIDCIIKGNVKIFGKKTSVMQLANRSYKKFARSFKWRILGRRGKHF